jgi:hypothetical protein
MKHCSFCGIGEDKAIIKSYRGVYYCNKHYKQYSRHGKCFERTMYDPNDYEVSGDVAKIFMYDRYGNRTGTAIVDLEDLDKCLQYKWHVHKGCNTNYAKTNSKERKTLTLHRFVTGYEGNLDIDHINGNGLDNRKENLRICSRSMNRLNLHRKYQGICKLPSGRYKARIGYNHKYIYIGTYGTIEEALEARKAKEIELFGETYRS